MKKATRWGWPSSGFARNRTWIWSFGNSYTIHCTTKPERDQRVDRKPLHGAGLHINYSKKKATELPFFDRTAYGNRTRYSTVKGWRINRFTNAAFPIRECKYTPHFLSSKRFFPQNLSSLQHREPKCVVKGTE